MLCELPLEFGPSAERNNAPNLFRHDPLRFDKRDGAVVERKAVEIRAESRDKVFEAVKTPCFLEHFCEHEEALAPYKCRTLLSRTLSFLADEARYPIREKLRIIACCHGDEHVAIIEVFWHWHTTVMRLNSTTNDIVERQTKMMHGNCRRDILPELLNTLSRGFCGNMFENDL